MLAEQGKKHENIALFYNRFILINGATSPLGTSIAMELAAHGAELILMDQARKPLQELSHIIHSKHKISSFICTFNLRDSNPRIYHRLGIKLEKKIPRLDAIILNAHYSGQNTNMLSYPFFLWKEVMQVNVDAHFMLIQTLIPLLLKGKQPQLVFNLHNDTISSKKGWWAHRLAQMSLENLMKIYAMEFSTSHLLIYGVHLASIYHPNRFIDKDITRIPLDNTAIKKIAILYPKILTHTHKTKHGKSINLYSDMRIKDSYA